MKRRVSILFCLLLVLSCFVSCAEKTVTCDRCGKEVAVESDTNMDDSWIVFCKECEEEAFGGTGVVQPG